MRKLLFFTAFLSGSFAYGQCFPDRHNTSWNEAWTSCETSENPNPQREAGHWISYDFGNTYRLGEAHAWNINAPDMLTEGFRDFYVDYSTDGKVWKNLGLFNLSQASGLSTYEGESFGSFSGDTARFVLLTAESNWGGDCSGLAEVRFEVIELVSRINSIASGDCFKASIYPNPHSESFNINLQSSCAGNLEYALYDHTGKKVWAAQTVVSGDFIQREIDTRSLAPGMYHLVVIQGKERGRYPVIKL